MSGLEPAIIGALISSGVGAAGSAIQGQKQRSSQRRIASERNRQQKELSRQERVASAKEVEEGRQAETAASRLAKAKGQQVASSALRQRGIAPRPISSFADIGKAVLDEGTVG